MSSSPLAVSMRSSVVLPRPWAKVMVILTCPLVRFSIAAAKSFSSCTNGLPARLGDLRFDRGALDREEADQVLRRRQRNDVLDALVVGKRGLVRGDGGEVVVQRRGHVFPSQKQKPPGFRRWRFWWDARLRLSGPVRQRAVEIKEKAEKPARHRTH